MSKEKTGKKHGCLITALVLIVVLAIVGGIFSHFGGFGTGPSADPAEFANYAKPVSELEVPENSQVIALGEATHGNKEFQELKLDVFETLVENYGVRAFALEADTGGCEVVNRYIHGGEGTLEEATEALLFTIYQTEEMDELISWMRAYNESAAPGEDLRFYGFDIQDYGYSYRLLLEETQNLGLDTAPLEALMDGEVYSEAYDADQRAAVYAELREQIVALGDDEDTASALHLVDVLVRNIELGKLYDSPNGNGVRDSFMAENVLWILDREKALGNGMVFVSAHNGHIEKTGSYGPDMKVMGNLLADELGDAYYAIGTDFYKAEVNLPDPKGDGRMTHSFYSYDPLAKAAATLGYESCWLDFASIPADSSLRTCIDEPIMMGSVGEYYSPLMRVLPQAYRVKREPSSPYDSMIFVAYAHPTETRSK